MLDYLIKNIVENMGTSAYGRFATMFTPNQTLPAENTLVSKFSYGQQTGKTLNNVVRIAEVADGLIVKLPMINGVKVPFTVIRQLTTQETGGKIKISARFHKDDLGTVHMTIPSEAKGQFPMLLSLKGQVKTVATPKLKPAKSTTPQKSFDEPDLWTIPKGKTVTQKNAPIQVKNWNLWEKVRAGILIWMIIEALAYVSRTF